MLVSRSDLNRLAAAMVLAAMESESPANCEKEFKRHVKAIKPIEKKSGRVHASAREARG